MDDIYGMKLSADSGSSNYPIFNVYWLHLSPTFSSQLRWERQWPWDNSFGEGNWSYPITPTFIDLAIAVLISMSGPMGHSHLKLNMNYVFFWLILEKFISSAFEQNIDNFTYFVDKDFATTFPTGPWHPFMTQRINNNSFLSIFHSLTQSHSIFFLIFTIMSYTPLPFDMALFNVIYFMCRFNYDCLCVTSPDSPSHIPFSSSEIKFFF